MPVSPRILRADIDDLRRRPFFATAREEERHEWIIKAGRRILVRHGRCNLTFAGFALGLRIGAATLRRHFLGFDDILCEIFKRHLVALNAHMARVPHDEPDRPRKLREAYYSFTHGLGILNDDHMLITRELDFIAEGLRAPLQLTLDGLGQMMAGPHYRAALRLLDTGDLTLDTIESMLAPLLAPPQAKLEEARAEEKNPSPATLGEGEGRGEGRGEGGGGGEGGGAAPSGAHSGARSGARSGAPRGAHKAAAPPRVPFTKLGRSKPAKPPTIAAPGAETPPDWIHQAGIPLARPPPA
jgi:AcrR family transcriptional regulator